MAVVTNCSATWIVHWILLRMFRSGHILFWAILPEIADFMQKKKKIAEPNSICSFCKLFAFGKDGQHNAMIQLCKKLSPHNYYAQQCVLNTFSRKVLVNSFWLAKIRAFNMFYRWKACNFNTTKKIDNFIHGEDILWLFENKQELISSRGVWSIWISQCSSNVRIVSLFFSPFNFGHFKAIIQTRTWNCILFWMKAKCNAFHYYCLTLRNISYFPFFLIVILCVVRLCPHFFGMTWTFFYIEMPLLLLRLL